jgi:hypothetical protein
MAAFDGDIQTAKELITEFGEVSKVRRVTPGVPDPLTPWKPVAPTIVDVEVTAVWLNYNLQSSGELYVGGSLIKSSDKKVLVAALDIADINPSDQLVRADGAIYKVVNAKLLDPNGQKILWTLQVEQ